MSEPLYLSRARVRRNVPAAALRALLLPGDAGSRAGAGHRMVWTLFADAPERGRDFLWREAEAGVYYLLSRRPPEDRHGLFELDAPKPFAPALGAGDRLGFVLRANATVAKSTGPGRRGKPCDVVMDAIRGVPPGSRAEHRAAAIDAVGRRWLEAQGARAGFGVASLAVTGYRTLRVEHAGPTARLGVLDFEGVLEVREPEPFVAALVRGFGRAKAFGCGLMLVRRARAS